MEVEKQLFEGEWTKDADGRVYLDGKGQSPIHVLSDYWNLVRFGELWEQTPSLQKEKGSCTEPAWIVDDKTITLLFFTWHSETYSLKDISVLGEVGKRVQAKMS